MAVTATAVDSDLIIHVANDAGTGTISCRYSDVKVAATDADVYDVANGTAGIAKLQSRTVGGVQRTNTLDLEDV
jgi:hypothetical protein